MAQVSWRAPDELVERVREAARRSHTSVNSWISRVLDAATDPAYAGSEVDRLRERLARAGLLEDTAESPVGEPPAAADIAAAREAAGRGTPLSRLVLDDRR